MPEQKPKLGWFAVYAGGRVFTSRETRWADLPDDELLAVEVFREDHHDPPIQACTTSFDAWDWYGHDDGELFVGNNDSLEENLRRYPAIPQDHWKRGIWVSTGEFVAALDVRDASTWPEYPGGQE